MLLERVGYGCGGSLEAEWGLDVDGQCPRGRLRWEGGSNKTLRLSVPRPVTYACLLVIHLLLAS
jgi:hypothetical protein